MAPGLGGERLCPDQGHREPETFGAANQDGAGLWGSLRRRGVTRNVLCTYGAPICDECM